MKTNRQIMQGLALLALATLNSQLSNACAQTSTNWNTLTNWTQTSAPSLPGSASWYCIASSSDGTRLVAGVGAGGAGGIYTSTNAGVTWTQTSATNEDWNSIASSSDGTQLAATSGGGIYTSTNAGATWTQTSASLVGLVIASSADGRKLAVAAGTSPWGVWTSTNAGVTWTQTSAPSEYPNAWLCIASSSDGTMLAAGAYPIGIWTSTNAGMTWTQTSAPSGSGQQWQSIASSSDGTKLAAVENSGGVYTSTNAGATWTQTSLPTEYWESITSSSDGTKLAAASSGGIYISTNAGVTWIQTSAPIENWTSISSSSDGTMLAATAYQDGIWTAQATIQTNAPGLTIGYSGNSVIVFWPTNASYTLQATTNLSVPNWSGYGSKVTTANGTNSITVTPAAGSMFFRLRSLELL